MAHRRQRFDPKAGFRQQKDDSGAGVMQALLKGARKSGQLNLSGRALSEVPASVWRINVDLPPEAKEVSLDNTDDRWWEQVDLTKLILASNALTQISDDIHMLPALTVLDLHDNQLTDLPDAIGKLANLNKINVSHNKLHSLPACISSLPSLQILLISHNEMTECGEHLGTLDLLEELDISQNQLTKLPRTLGYLTKLMRLNIANNKIQCLPPEIGSLNSLRYLECTHNELRLLPSEVATLPRLELLYLRHNRLTDLPVLTDCKALKELHVGNNAIHSFTPDHLEHLQQVSVLDLRDNKIANLPKEITVLQQLERLDVTNNDLSALPYELGTMRKLKSLILDGNPLKSIRRDIVMRGTNELKKYLASRIEEAPPAQNGTGAAAPAVKSTQGMSGIIGGVGELDPFTIKTSKTLDYSAKKVAEIPDEVWDATEDAEIAIVNFSKNALTQVPERLSSFRGSLRELYLSFNRLSTVSASVGQMSNLVMLDVRNNALSTLPQEVSNIPRLREVNISCNRFTELPSCLYMLTELEIILASDNQIQNVDAPKLCNLSKLGTLDLQNNNIVQVPPELGNCTQLRSLQLGGNAFRMPRPAILDKGTVAVLDYLRGRIPT